LILVGITIKIKDMPASQFRLPRLCEYCGKPFEAKTVATRFCSNACGNRASKERLKKEKEEARKRTLLEHATHIAKIQTRPYITVAEATALFGISKDTVRRLIKKGKLPAVNLGERLTKISRIHIEAMFTAVQIPK
jgi:excisionase family DNA binding protein